MNIRPWFEFSPFGFPIDNHLFYFVETETRRIRERTRKTEERRGGETARGGSQESRGSQWSRSKMVGWAGAQIKRTERERVTEKYWPRQREQWEHC